MVARGARLQSIGLLFAFFIGALAIAQQRPIPRNARIYISELPEDLHVYLKAEFVKKKVPLRIVADIDSADIVLTGVAEGDEKRKWHEGWLTVEKDKFTGAVEIYDKKTGEFLWAGEAGDRSLWWGALARGGPRKVAGRLASKVKKAVAKR